MIYSNELELEAYIRSLINRHITSKKPIIYALKNKKVADIVVCRDGKRPALFFIEVKYHRVAHGRIGFGHSKGCGFQPEVVCLKSAYFEKNLRWVLASEEHKVGELLFVSSDTIRNNVSDGVVGEKFNNVQKKIFEIEPMHKEKDFIKELKKWLES